MYFSGGTATNYTAVHQQLCRYYKGFPLATDEPGCNAACDNAAPGDCLGFLMSSNGKCEQCKTYVMIHWNAGTTYMKPELGKVHY